ncbi:MAG: Npun_R1517 family heterocyst differentiation transcriptional regulator [Alkalinema sp. FL-bin-369]|nr:Npun_R1517 family heterocyst differentiation transcriptional regulator [Leptolyngbyaceae cyanobacterium LF-bin-369]
MQQLQSLTRPSIASPLGVSPVVIYECDIHLKFRMIEEKNLPADREELLELLLDAFGYGGDEYLEPLQVAVNVTEVSEVEASPEMRRQLIRLRNSKDLV